MNVWERERKIGVSEREREKKKGVRLIEKGKRDSIEREKK